MTSTAKASNMLDLHTHILPAMDDGSRDVDETLSMLSAEKEAGVTTIALTPHFYPHREDPERFLRRRARCFAEMENAESYPAVRPGKVLLGAEVAYFDGISRVENIEALCLGDTSAMLIEMPFCTWNDRMLGEIGQLQKTCGIQPILAHVERYLQFQNLRAVEELVDEGVWIQTNASFFQRFSTKRKALKMLDRGLIHFLGTDCHNMQSRQPNMLGALQVIDKKIGKDALSHLKWMEKALLEGTR